MQEPPDVWGFTPVLDGVILDDCIEADVRQGIVICFRRDGSGGYVLKADGTGSETEERRGRVEIIHPDDMDEWKAANGHAKGFE